MIVDTNSLAAGLGVTPKNLLVLLFAIGVIMFVIYKDLPKKEQKMKLLIITAMIVVTMLLTTDSLFKKESPTILPVGDVEWQVDYMAEAREQLTSYDVYVQDTEYYAYNDPIIMFVAKKIASDSNGSLEAIENAADYVYSTVSYVYESDQACFSATASSVLAKGTGQCDTQSIALVSILRRMGVAAQPVGGCIIVNRDCRWRQLSQSMGGIGRVPQFTTLQLDDVVDATQVSRGGGGLHAWVVAWTPSGWVNVESTAGKLIDDSCYTYHVELYPDNDNKKNICVSTNNFYALACRNGDLATLDLFGLGLATEVNP